MADTEIDQAKQAIRQRVWDLLEQEHAAPPGVHGHIPTFYGAEAAGNRLAGLPEWRAAQIIKAVPDEAQLPTRARALADGKLVYMAVPRLAELLPFYLLDPQAIGVPPHEAASSAVAATIARKVGVEEMKPVDLIICGSVAVNRHGTRLGKGAGYSDIEVALLQEAGLIKPTTTIVTTVHSLQVVNEELPETRHDFSVDLIVTPEEVIHCEPPRRPSGVYWDELTPEMINAIPALAARSRG
ncbi:5-formyltetrahydrofolate cyclo-ligase [Actinoplanes tereljensis]|uniref:5-formyltetrahydrofolate cyclo-ligase n=1 Tax=Paractinoplanes tereljensis TaxID=571912 RepID=A0A919TZV7_9ACTN|nr:5-formyltetrahydrofolate cyclo-ligase [Actinoplanes tereljensis]GIF26675.1 5-formyltetrahydrofolate cyclo-ligase [Actinoplanes tereljensis]